MRVRRALLLVVLIAVSCEAAFAEPSPAAPAQCTTPAGGPLVKNVYRFCYNGTTWLVDEPSNVRFTNKDRVEVEVLHLNYFRYTLSFDVQEQKSDAYQYLTKLWTSVLGVGFGSLVGALGPGEALTVTPEQRRRRSAEEEFVLHLRELLRYVEALDTKITRAIAVHRKPGLDSGEIGALQANLGTVSDPCAETWDPGQQDGLIGCSVRSLSQRVTAKFNELERGVHTDSEQFAVSVIKYTDVYKTAKQGYADVHGRADQFEALALKSLGSETRKVGKRDAGTRLTLNLAAVDASGRSPIGDVSYFVETAIPLVVHGGLVYSHLDDVTFEKVKRASGFSEEDLFQKKGDENHSRNFTMFMGWRLATLDGRQPNTSRFSALVSLGTDIDAPGQKVYLAPTLLLFSRVAISYGLVFGKEANGEQQTLEPDVFRIVKEDPSAAQFFAISTKIF